MLPGGQIQAMPGVNCWDMTMMVEKISAVTFRVLNMKTSVRFYRDVLGMEIIYGTSTITASDIDCQLGCREAVDLSASENSSERKRVCRSTHLTDSCRC